MAPRSNFATEFLLRELLSALGAPLTTPNADSARADSFSESLSEDTESQSALRAANGAQPRVMLIRRTNSSQQTVTLVDREYDMEAFIPSHVSVSLQQEQGYLTLGRLRGSVVRVTKYHFATLARCLAADQQSREASVSAPNVTRDKARVYLWVDALAIVEDNELAVKSLPGVYTHPLVVERLQVLSDAELEKQLMIQQGLPPFRKAESDRFDDDRPLLEEDCVIPEEQEQELEEQEEWGPPTTIERQPTDSELIEENGSVPMLESQVVRGPASPDKLLSTQESVASPGDLSATEHPLVTLSGNLSESLSEVVKVTPSLDSQKYPFQQENIRETFVVGSDLESSDSEEENDGVYTAKESTPSTPKSQRQLRSNRNRSSAHSSPAPTTPKSTQNSWAIVDLTDDTPEKAPRATPASERKETQEQEPKTETGDSQEETGIDAASLASSHTPPRTRQPAEKETPKGWTTSFLRKLASNLGLGTPSVEASLPRTQSSDEEDDDSTESDQYATQILVQTEKEEKEDEPAHPEELISSQATVVLHYAVDNDEDVNAFEYEGMLSDDDMASPRSAEHVHDDHAVGGEHTSVAGKADSADDHISTEGGAKVSITPQKRLASKEDTTDFKTPSPSAQAATPGTEKRAEADVCQTPTVSTSLEEHPENLAHGSSHPASPPNSKDPVLSTDPSAQLSPVKSPSKLVISVGSAGNTSNGASRTGFSAAESRGSKRRRQQTNSEDLSPSTATQQEHPGSVAQPQLRTKTQKCRRRDILSAQALHEAGSQSPQFEQPAASFLPRRTRQSDHGSTVAGNYSLDAVCRSLGSHARHQTNEEDQARSSRQPCRAWKRYENLFPPLNMTRLKQMMAESNGRTNDNR